jgi:hypothetical protein
MATRFADYTKDVRCAERLFDVTPAQRGPFKNLVY